MTDDSLALFITAESLAASSTEELLALIDRLHERASALRHDLETIGWSRDLAYRELQARMLRPAGA